MEMTIYKTVWHDGPKGEERDIPALVVGRKDDGNLVFLPVHNPRGRSYAFRNDKRYRINKKREAR